MSKLQTYQLNSAQFKATHTYTHTYMWILNDFQSAEATVVIVLLKNCKSHWDGHSMSLDLETKANPQWNDFGRWTDRI